METINDIPQHNIDKLISDTFDILKDMKEEHRTEFEKHIQNLKKIKSETDSGAKGYHEAVDDVVKAMNDFLLREGY
jgi:hypothetical protein